MSKCVICDSWEKTPHAKRYTTPIPPHYVEEGMVIGYWLGTHQPDSSKDLCKKHTEMFLAFDKQQKKRTAPTIPPPPPRMPISQVIANKIAEQLPNGQPPPTGNGPLEAPAPIGELQKSFLAIAQSCAAEYIKQHPGIVQTAPVQAKEPETPTVQLETSIPLDVLRQALLNIAQHCSDPDAAQYAAKILDGSAVPPPPESPPPGTIPCIVCHKYVLPGEIHSC